MKRMPKAWTAKHTVNATVASPNKVGNGPMPDVMCPVTNKPMRIVSQRIVRGDQEHFIPVAVSEDARIVLPLTNEHMEKIGNEYNSHPSGGFHVPKIAQGPKPANFPVQDFGRNIQWD